MRAGNLRHLVSIESAQIARDPTGAALKSWGTFASVWAAVRPLRGQEFHAARSINATVTHEVTMRYLGGVTAAMRVNFDGRILRIESVMNLNETNEQLRLLCSEVVNGG